MRCLMNETNFRIPDNPQSKSATLWAQESNGKDLSRQSSLYENVKMYSLLISGVKYKWKTSWIDDAIKQLGEIDEEIAEEGFPPINDNAKKTAKKILNILNSEGMEYAPFVYPTTEGEIEINLKSRNYSLVILVISEKNVETYSSLFNSATECHSFTPPFKKFNDFIVSQLRALRKTSLSQNIHDR